MPHLRRPPSYSDSLFFLPSEPLEPLILPQQPSIQPQHNEFGSRPIAFTNAETWYNRCMSFLFHISLISLFETIFFFQFISVSEDSGLQKTLDGYITNILTSCNQWPPNQTLIVNDILSVLINTTDIKPLKSCIPAMNKSAPQEKIVGICFSPFIRRHADEIGAGFTVLGNDNGPQIASIFICHSCIKTVR